MAPSALAADLPRSWGLTVALMQGEVEAENTMLDGCGWYWRRQSGRRRRRRLDLDQPGWLAGWLAYWPGWLGGDADEQDR